MHRFTEIKDPTVIDHSLLRVLTVTITLPAQQIAFKGTMIAFGVIAFKCQAIKGFQQKESVYQYPTK